MIEIHRWYKDSEPYTVLDAHRWSIEPGKSYALHRHKFYEFFLLEFGEVIHRFEDREENIHAGTCYFISPSCVHGFSNKGDQVCNWVNIRIEAGAHEKLRQVYEPELGGWFWDAGKARRFQLSEDLSHAFSAMLDHLPLRPNRQLDLSCLMAPIFMGLQLDRSQEKIPTWLSRSLKRYDTFHGKNLELSNFIRECQKSRDHVTRVVREHFGMTTVALLRQRRLDRAANALRYGELSIAEVASDSGFENLSGFYRHFRSRFGLSPGTFRSRPS